MTHIKSKYKNRYREPWHDLKECRGISIHSSVWRNGRVLNVWLHRWRGFGHPELDGMTGRRLLYSAASDVVRTRLLPYLFVENTGIRAACILSSFLEGTHCSPVASLSGSTSFLLLKFSCYGINTPPETWCMVGEIAWHRSLTCMTRCSDGLVQCSLNGRFS